MKGFVLGFLTATVLFVGGFFVLSNYFKDADGAVRVMGIALFRLAPDAAEVTARDYSAAQPDGETKRPESAQFCDLQKSTCSGYAKADSSGNLKVTVRGAGKPIGDVEVDLGTKPGASQYYMNATGADGVALFENIPAGSYKIYFNFNNFPKEYDASQLASVKVAKDSMTEAVVELKSK